MVPPGGWFSFSPTQVVLGVHVNVNLQGMYIIYMPLAYPGSQWSESGHEATESSS